IGGFIYVIWVTILRLLSSSIVVFLAFSYSVCFFCHGMLCVIVGSFFFSSRRRHTRSVSAFLLNRSSDLFVKDWFRYESHFVHGRDSLVDILKERGLLSESDAVQPLIGKKS